MCMIEKRDGTIVGFNKSKPGEAVLKVFKSVDGNISKEALAVSDKISESIKEKVANSKEILNVENIQDLVIEELKKINRDDIVKEYISYRLKRTKIREKNSALLKQVIEKLEASNVLNQNANVDEYSFGGRTGEASSALTKHIALNYIMSEKAVYNHLNNRIYTHDLDSYVIGDHNCLTIPFDKLLKNGFNTRQTDVRPAQSANSAMQLLAVIFQLQSLQQFGGVSASHLDHTMVPYVRKSFFKHYLVEYLKSTGEFYELDILNMSDEEFDEWISYNKNKYLEEMNLSEDDFYFNNKENLNKKFYQAALFETRKEVYQAVEAMYHNLNTLQSRSGNQLPFTSINYGTCTLPEGRLITKAILECSIKGIGGVGRTSIFPCGIFQCMKGVNRKPGEPNYDLFKLALKSTSKRLYPNYCNVDWSVNEGYDKNDPRTYTSTMGKCKCSPCKTNLTLLKGVA